VTGKPKARRARKQAKEPGVPAPVPAVEASSAPEVPPTAAPERELALRVPLPPEERPRPTRRRAIFIDVENTSRPGRIATALEELAVDRADAATDIIASGNWRVVGNETARLLASRGAQLVHSAPATGVRDWSDLRIAVAAGVWGDRLDIVSDDRAFDAVGDVAATLGVEYRRHAYRRAPGAAAEAAPARTANPRRRGERRGRAQKPAAPPPEPQPAPEVVASASEVPASEVPHAAPAEDLLAVVHETLEKSPQGVWLDAIALRLKALGYQRPPSSPRLITRLRALKELTVSERGFVTHARAAAPAGALQEATPAEAAPTSAPSRRRRRRGGRGRSKRGPTSPPAQS
jgi:hypothetical protein